MRDRIRFLLGDKPIEIGDFSPTLTILDWLRLSQRQTGSKEGCGEGDCGACTVVIGRPDGDRLRYEAINSCIRFVPTLDGCHLLTVEHLKSPEGALHPAQQALVATHGSQCGFCTPGFVMSLFALYLNETRPDVQSICDRLAGNLCRCTGYAPIIAAAQLMYDLPAPAWSPQLSTEALRAAIGDADDAVLITHRDQKFIAPTTVDGLADAILAWPGAVILSGATDVGLWVTKQQRDLPALISTGRVAELRRWRETPDEIRLGAGVAFNDAAPVLGRLFPDFGELLRRIGGHQVRNAGTIGGNIANGSPIGDTPPALIALGAKLTLRRGGERRTLALEDYFVAYGEQDRRPGEFVESLAIPKLDQPMAAGERKFRVYKISKRFDQDISALCGAFFLERAQDGTTTTLRIAFGGMAGTPKRARKVEAFLVGKPWSESHVAAAMALFAEDYAPLTDWRATAGYRLKTAANLLMKFYLETSSSEIETRLVGDRRLAHV